MSTWDWLVWVVPLAVLAAGMRRPRLGLEIFVAAIPLFGSPPGGPYLGALDAAAIAVLFTSRRGTAVRSKLDWALLAFVVVAVASLFPIAYRPPSWRPSVLAGLAGAFSDVGPWSVLFTWRSLADLLLGWALFLAIRRSYTVRSAKRLGLALAAGILAANLVGIAEQIGILELDSYRPIGLALFETRMHSFFFHSGWFAQFVILAAPVACAALIAGKRGRTLAIAVAGSSVVAIVFSQQRGAWFALLAQLALLAVLAGPAAVRRNRLRLAAALATSVLLLAGMVLIKPQLAAPLQTRLTHAVSDLSNRTGVWRASVEMFRDRPILGSGIGSFSPALDAGTPGTRHNSSWLTAHSLYFMVLAERGLLGLLALVVVLVISTFGLGARWRRAQGEERTVIAGLLVSLCGFVVLGIVQYLFFVRSIGWLCWVLFGWIGIHLPRGGRTRADHLALGLTVIGLVCVPIRALAVEPALRRGDRGYGFHAPEHSPEGVFQWTSGRAVRRLPWQGETLILRLANGHPKAAVRPIEVEVRIDGVLVATLALTDGWRERRFELGRPTRDFVVLEVDAAPTFRPFSDYRRHPELAPSRDIRRLGVALAEPRWE